MRVGQMSILLAYLEDTNIKKELACVEKNEPCVYYIEGVGEILF